MILKIHFKKNWILMNIAMYEMNCAIMVEPDHIKIYKFMIRPRHVISFLAAMTAPNNDI